MGAISESPANRAIRRYMLLAGVTLGGLVVGAGGWAATMNISAAVIGSGVIGVEGNTKKIQHGQGGVVREIRVSNGTLVRAGDILLRLDGVEASTTLAATIKEIDQLDARRLRLIAERDGVEELIDPIQQIARLEDGQFIEGLKSETSLFKARREQIDSKTAQLKEQIAQIEQQRDGTRQRLISNAEEASWSEQQAQKIENLAKEGLVQFSRLADSKRMVAQLSGERSQLLSDEATAGKRITEIELQIAQLDKDRRAEVLTDLLDTNGKLAKLAEQRLALEDQIEHLDIRAPVDGIVHQLATHTIGGLLSPGETAMNIVPTRDMLTVDMRIKPNDVDQVSIGQATRLRFSAFNQRTTSEIEGRVESLSPDVSVNEQTGETWYSARIAISPQERAKLGELALIPGMPVEAYIKAEPRTALAYLIKPISDQMERAMREN
ncbi:HlyD family type I secretion periplasmic adaptor subunit [Rhizobium wenxiniae]|uniref:Membrane fusion protein (MFP) family protein n=1 Tax=Rhizobium wenxiniae TaxID=1737357 RepID=A0A7W9Y4L6_9HYPH|nr:HlyD family type I secretion periplasmic adaptor subunit [Rhizobium wenxiniae]MBB6161912.1 HlyD family secretion protein [Rhizobium wenxiniae]GGF79083.1 HlyD family type I secretion periplasmic adaptor subunit [Rhizobium wenxiniae]